MNFEYKDLKRHIGHKISVVAYGNQNVSIECDTCMQVLKSVDKQEVQND